MTKTFKNQIEATAVMAPLHKAGKVQLWRPVTAFGRTTVSIFHGAGWLTLTTAEFAALVA
jgi:hypothetical protein